MKKVIGIGNALTDILLQINSDDALAQLELPKGSMQLVDEERQRKISGYLEAEKDGAYLPRVLSEILEGILSTFGSRVGRLLFKQIVEQSILTHIIAADTDIDLDTLEKLRGRCVQDARRTNGEISFQDILRFQKGL